MTSTEKAKLCRWAGVPSTDTAAAEILETCYERAEEWYRAAGVEPCPESRSWTMDLAAWFYDNRGRSDAVIPPYIITSVHQLRGGNGYVE